MLFSHSGKRISSIAISAAIVLTTAFHAPSVGAATRYQLTVDESAVIKSVTSDMFGTNFEWGGYNNGGKFYVKENTNEINPEFVTAVRDMLPLCRMAGSSANKMYWKNAVGKYPDERQNLQFWEFEPMKISFGPVEWVRATQAAQENARYVYTLNVKDTAENNADLIRFMTLMPDDANAVGSDGINWAQRRIDYGIDNPVPVMAWEIGNELDSDTNGAYTAEEYAEVCRKMIDTVRAVNPGVKISVHTVTAYDGDDDAWLKPVLQSCADGIDYVSLHYYYNPQDMKAVDDRLDSVKATIDKYAGGKDIKIIMSEQASMRYTDDESDEYRRYYLPHTMRGVMGTAEYFMRSMLHPELEAAVCHATYSSSWATLYPEDGTVKRTATGDLLRIFSQNLVGDALKCTVGNFAKGKNSDISACAVRTAEGLSVAMVNESSSEVTVDMKFNNRYDLVGCDTIHPNDDNADNINADNYIGIKQIEVSSDSGSIDDISKYSLKPYSVALLRLKPKDSTDIQTSFFEDFEKYQTAEKLSDDGTMIINGRPADGDYSDTTVYPNGTASVYEGNAMNNIAVKDANGNSVYGGLDGWYGFYGGARGNYYPGNRRLTVGAYSGTLDAAAAVNCSKSLRFEPSKSDDSVSSFNRVNVDLAGYSFLSAQVNLSSETDDFGTAAISLTTNPKAAPNGDGTESACDSEYRIIEFSGSAEGTIDVIFDGQRLGSIDKSYFQSVLNEAAVWYTVQLRMINSGGTGFAKLDFVRDNDDKLIFSTDWQSTDFCYGASAEYGIRFCAHSKKDAAQPRVLLDNIVFSKEKTLQNFEDCNITEVTAPVSKESNLTRIVNGRFGNTNDDIYNGGVYEGNICKNNFVYNSLEERVYGSYPQWQGYISSVGGADAYNATNRRCSLRKITASYPYSALSSKLINLEARPSGTSAKSVYAGMENVDFSDGTVFKCTVEFAGNTTAGEFKLQLTNGRSVTAANGVQLSDGTYTAPTAKYEDSHSAYYDVVTFKNQVVEGVDTGCIFFGVSDKKAGTYSNGSSYAYDITYVVDSCGGAPTEKVIVANHADGKIICETVPRAMRDGNFTLSGTVGFRFVCSTDGSGVGAAQIDNIETEKFFAAEVGGSGFFNVNADSAKGVVSASFTLPQASRNSVICAVYDGDGKLAATAVKTANRAAGYNNTSIGIDLPDDYSEGGYTLKLFCWSDISSSLRPLIKEYVTNGGRR